jgi:hypothetical protein
VQKRTRYRTITSGAEENQTHNHHIRWRKRTGYRIIISGRGREPDTELTYLVQEKNRMQNNYILCRKRTRRGTIISGAGGEPDTELSHLVRKRTRYRTITYGAEENHIQDYHIRAVFYDKTWRRCTGNV